jgi:uncharacterized protein YciI
VHIFAVDYVYDPAAADRRGELLEQHREWLRGIDHESRLVGAGVYPDGSGALLIIVNPDEAATRAELAHEPFARAALAERIAVREWRPTWGPVGEIAAQVQG